MVSVVGAITLAACSAPGAAAPSAPSAPASRDATTTATATATATATDVTGTDAAFVSTRYGYRLQPPTGWDAAETPGTGGVHPNEPGVDTFRDSVGHILSVIGERAVPSLPGWACAINLHLQGKEHRLSAEHVDQITVSDVPARISEYHLVIKPYVIHYLTVEVVRDGAGLTLSLESTTGNDDEDRRILDSILDSLALDT